MSEPGPELRPEWRRVPAPSRLRAAAPVRAEILRRHDAALDAAAPTYIDPSSGFSVFTSAFLAARNYCCESGCRHCPYAVGSSD